ncbi:hypothetical protein ACJIZ3_017746 [Penstemon smallii]|uniref:NADH dehydrogenase subunit 5 n=1 Tax=Penstemon smallii TaxID=265156 RepID=A0ABD3SWF4_9LAMI
MKLENLPNFVVFMTFTICFTVLYSPRLIGSFLPILSVMYVQSLDFKIYSRAWIYQRIYSAGSISLMSISTAVANFKIHSLSFISEGPWVALGSWKSTTFLNAIEAINMISSVML